MACAWTSLMNWDALPGFLLVVAGLAAIIGVGFLKRRPLRPQPGAMCAYRAWCSATADLNYVSKPFARIEVWDEELLISNLNLRVPLDRITKAFIEKPWGGSILVLELSSFDVQRIEVGGCDLNALLAAIRARKPAL